MSVNFEDIRAFYYSEAKSQIDRWPGLMIMIFACFVLQCLLLKFFEVNLAQISGAQLVVPIPLTVIIIFLYWVFIRRLPSFGRDTIGILIALTKIDPEVDGVLGKMHAQLQLMVNSEKLKRDIKIQYVSERLSPKKEPAAFDLLHKSGAEIIIWGAVDRGDYDKRKVTRFTPIAFSYTFLEKRERVQEISRNLSSILAQKKWVIDDKTEFIDREYLTQNIEEVCLYILGLGTFFKKDFNASIDLLSLVLRKYKTRNSDLSPEDQIALSHVLGILDAVYKRKIFTLELWPESLRVERDRTVGEQIVLELENLGFDSALLKAQIEFSRGRISEAIGLITQAQKRLPKDSGPCFSLAFLFFHEKDSQNGYKWINEAFNKNTNQVARELPLIAIWYEAEMKVSPENFLLNYPLGLIYYEMGNDIPAKECFDNLLREISSSQDSIFRKMLYRSQKLSKKIEKRLLSARS